jgi:hypothetical protein
MDIKLVYRIHKWLAVVAAAVTLGWFASGALMLLPEPWLTLSPNVSTRPDAAESHLQSALEFDRATIAPSVALSELVKHVGRPIRATQISLRRLPGHVAYQVNTARDGLHFVDAVDGEVFAITEELAKQIVANVLGSTISLGPVTRQTESTGAYPGPLPAYRVPVEDGKGTVFYVEEATGQPHLTDPLSRITRRIVSLHGFWPLRGILPGYAVRGLMLALTIAGSAMSLAGVVILIAQLRRWWQGPSRAADLR